VVLEAGPAGGPEQRLSVDRSPKVAATTCPCGRGHEVLERAAELDGYRAAALPAPTLDEDPLPFAAALTAGEALAAKIPRA
jgi:hypothetical protein